MGGTTVLGWMVGRLIHPIHPNDCLSDQGAEREHADAPNSLLERFGGAGRESGKRSGFIKHSTTMPDFPCPLLFWISIIDFFGWASKCLSNTAPLPSSAAAQAAAIYDRGYLYTDTRQTPQLSNNEITTSGSLSYFSCSS